MDNARNQELVRRVIEEGFNRGNVEALDELYAPGYREHQYGMPPTLEGFKQGILELRKSFPDLKLAIEEISAVEDLVWIRMVARGTHRGAFIGMAPTGKTFAISVFDLCRLRDGRIVEHWGTPDRFALMHQLGLLPRPAPAA